MSAEFARGRGGRSARGAAAMASNSLDGSARSADTRKATEPVGTGRKLLEYEQTISDQARRLEEKQNDIEQLRGRLEESRNARDVTLQDMKESHKTYIRKIHNLSVLFDEAQQQLTKLHEDREQKSLELKNVHEVKIKLSEAVKDNEQLVRQMEALESSNGEMAAKMSRMKNRIRELEKSLNASENDKIQTECILRQSIDRRESDRNANNTMKEQFYEDQIRKLTSENSDLKASVDELRVTCQQLSTDLGNEKKDHGLCKVDVRILNREKKILADRVELYEDSRKQIEDDHQKCSQIIEELKNKLLEAERCASLSKTQAEHDKRQLKYSEQRYDELKAENMKSAAHIQQFETEILNLKNRLERMDNLQSKVSETDSLLTRKQREIEERDKKIAELRNNLGKLKEAATYLDNQLKSFEGEILKNHSDLNECENKRLILEAELKATKETLRQAKTELNEMKSLKLLLQKKVDNSETAARELESESSSRIKSLEKELSATTAANSELQNKVERLLKEVDTIKEEKQMTEYVLATFKGANEGLTGEVQNILDNFVRSKDEAINLRNEVKTYKSALSDAIQKAETYKSLYEKWLEAYNKLETDASNTDIQYRTKCDQLSKLVSHLNEENEKLTKKKHFNFFKFGFEKSVPVSPMVIPPTTPLNTPRNENVFRTPRQKGIENTPRKTHTPFTPKENIPPRRIIESTEASTSKAKTPGTKTDSKPTPMKLIKEHQAVKNLEGQAANLKQQLAVLQDMSESGLRKSVIFKGNSFDVNCSYLVENNLYVLGCDDGLFSVKLNGSAYRGKVRIDGVSTVHNIEAVDCLRLVLMIEGSTRRLVGVERGMLKVAAQAASCSKPSIDVFPICDVQDISLISYRAFGGELSSASVCLCLATHRHLYVLSWTGREFIQVRKINARENITCMLISPLTVIFGSDIMWQLDIKNFELEEFIDRTDSTMYYLQFSCETQATFPLQIIDLGITDESVQEYLLCFSELAVFVDSEGRRTRQEDVVWTKPPIAIVYQDPNLYILHFLSVEIIKINRDSYTRQRVTENEGTISSDHAVIPKSRYLSLDKPRLLGLGSKPGSIVVSNNPEMSETEILEVDLDPYDSS